MQDEPGSNVHIGGSAHLTGSAIAGRNAHIANTPAQPGIVADPEAIRQALGELAARIRDDSRDIDDSENAAACADRIAAEVGREQPNKIAVAGLVHSLGRAVGHVGTFARSVSAIEEAINAFFG